MTRRSLGLTEGLHEYLCEVSLREPPLFARLRAETGKMPRAQMQIAPEEGQFMSFLVELIGARLCLEIGTFTGYSALWVASALPPEGRLVCCDIDAETTAVAQRYWREAGLADRIELRLGPALATLGALEEEYPPGSFDFAFIDADKENDDAYYEAALRLVRPGGLILIDNALRYGGIAIPERENYQTLAVDRFNRKLRDDPRVALSVLPVADGLSLARKR